jgi:hypothetical protein
MKGFAVCDWLNSHLGLAKALADPTVAGTGVLFFQSLIAAASRGSLPGIRQLSSSRHFIRARAWTTSQARTRVAILFQNAQREIMLAMVPNRT